MRSCWSTGASSRKHRETKGWRCCRAEGVAGRKEYSITWKS
ncbi:hypothetical protein DUNSADRAFT_10718 [Dunaliella salina]|uniref:Uncharacterized protein n=1 Tax=Dunaliella salina TaxID=3046 RepID=A0ABQ7FS36_DUNSA|nr:hypothetical protein DUNSADRAFT_10718 [Dunaliella salina]|eukprot:KAF5825390.1 hypothetical protein DUNSADRAFT_10718 [Dunaliella salina]